MLIRANYCKITSSTAPNLQGGFQFEAYSQRVEIRSVSLIGAEMGKMMILLQRLELGHLAQFLEAVRKSTKLHHPWVSPPSTADAFRELLEKQSGQRSVGYLAVNEDSDLIGCVNLSEIVRGVFQSAFLGFYAFVPFEGQGLMRQSLKLALAQAFTTHGLHRVEANIQPHNERSKALVQSLGFRLEGYSPRYLQISGQWCDHERYAITVEEWTDSVGHVARLG